MDCYMSPFAETILTTLVHGKCWYYGFSYPFIITDMIMSQNLVLTTLCRNVVLVTKQHEQSEPQGHLPMKI